MAKEQIKPVLESAFDRLDLLENESIFKDVFFNSPDPTWLINGENNFILCNLAAVNILGYKSVKDLLATHPSELSPEFQLDGQNSREKADEMMALAYRKGVQRFEWVHCTKNGRCFPVEVTLVKITIFGKKSLYCIWRDISMRVQAESDLTEAQENFHQAQKMEALGTLVGGIAHDFNNMLAGMTGNLYLARKEAKNMPRVLQKLMNIESLSVRAADMIRQLLTFARKGQVDIKQVSLNDFLKEALTFLHASVSERIALHYNICKDMLLVNGDATQIHQVLMNLVNNACDAVKHVDKPCVSVKLEVFQTDDLFIATHPHFRVGTYARLSVGDNGCGIPEDQIEHLFEPFFTTKEVGKGTGLGLAMVFGAIKTHHGYVEVDSIEGEGTTFHIFLPLLDTDEAAPALLQNEVAIEGGGEVILLVDDELHVLETGKEVLQSLGYQVLVALDGLEAVELFSKNQDKISLIIMDIVMAKLDGLMAIKRIRKIRPDVKVIFVTGYDKNISLPNALLIGDTPILSKPYSIEELSKTTKNQLDLQSTV